MASRTPVAAAGFRRAATVVSVTASILKQVEALGYAVSVHRVNGVIEMHAVNLAQMVRSDLEDV